MSSPIVNINANTQTEHQVVGKVAATEQTKEPRAKKETLSAKYSKFLIFGYSLIQSLKSQDLLTDESVERAYSEIKLMDSVEDQTEFYETYLSQSNETGKVMRKFIVQRNKPPKAAKAKKEKKANVDQEVKVKKPRTKKTEKVTADGDADIVNELVAAATGETETETEEGVVVEKTEEAPKVKKVKELTAEQQSVKDAKAKEVADKKEAKAKEVAEKKEAKETKAKEVADAKEVKAKEVAEKKEAKAKEVAEKKDAKEAKAKEAADKKEAKEADAKAKTTAEVENISVSISEESVVEESVVEESVVEESEEDEEVHTQEITVDGKEYLLDGLNHIYSVITHDEIGTYDPVNRTIQLDHA
tara:strand:+ start:1817 stop:2893 length:1077 start_codon:yes stop_codon:yes gene_type:complete